MQHKNSYVALDILQVSLVGRVVLFDVVCFPNVPRMKTIVLLLLLCPLSAFAQSGNVETTVDEAVRALPEGLREGAAVLAFGANGSLGSVRQGSPRRRAPD